MRIVVAGGTGFLGRALVGALAAAGHDVSVLTRRARSRDDIVWTPDGASGPWAGALVGVDAVVNLAGEGIADARWTPARKRALVDSRRDATASLVEAVLGLPRPPRVFISGSGIDIYGPHGDDYVTEATPPGHDFMASMATAWEQAAAPVAACCPLVLLRTSMVIGRGGGALARMLLPFKLGVGGRLGSGRQWMSWIHLDDWVALTTQLLTDPAATGPFNLTAPGPVRNEEFTRALGRALGRPTVLPVPAFALRLALGELSDVLLTGRRAMPAKADAIGFRFRYPRIDEALAASV
ncbi:MAG: TIGR01777 family oxidoreductase [Vicinamibacterales bacterium]